ncbi:TlpA disulfide reductase family protein [Chryseobacterium angstadtii]|uniref:TlpA disulfide reductase family protein n=1 Tax=Chryseobacterium angstadtii TaxID=558151 RepID=UPI00065AE0FE|nr:TlpA disulfide reductase family protein [Chryseobacterium angstadtii]
MILFKKTNLLILLVGFLVISCKRNDNTSITLNGQIKGISAKELYLGSYYLAVPDTITVDKAGGFEKKLPIKTAGFFSLRYKNQEDRFVVYLEPGKKSHIALDAENNKVTVTGDLAEENKLYEELKIGNDSLSKQFETQYAKLDEAAFLSKMKAFEDSQNKLINTFSKNKKLNPDFLALLHQDVFYTSLEWKQHYPFYHTPPDVEVDVDKLKDYYAALDKGIKEDTALLKLSSYREAINRKINIDLSRKANKDKDKELDPDLRYINAIKTNIKSPQIQAGVSYDFVSALLSMVKDKSKMLEIYKSFGIKDGKLKELERLYADLKKTDPGNAAPAFSYKDIDGKAHSLADFKGKVVYIDVWATWCSPCKDEIPHLKKLEQDFAGKNIEFISISLDKDLEKWKTYVTKNHLEGVQLHADGEFDSKIAKDYQIRGIPRFILIGKDGKIINSTVERPSDKKIKEILDKALV